MISGRAKMGKVEWFIGGVLIGTGWNAPSAAPATPPYGVHVVQNHCAGEDETQTKRWINHYTKGTTVVCLLIDKTRRESEMVEALTN